MWHFFTIGPVNKDTKSKESFADNHLQKILRLFDVLLTFPWCTIITYKHGIYELPHELLSNLRLRVLLNLEISWRDLL